MSIRKLLLIAVVGLVAFFSARALWRALASPETKIRWRAESMVEGFNSMRMQPVLDGIARDFTDDTSSHRRDEIRQVLIWMFLNEIDAQNGEFLWRCEFDPSAMEIDVAEDRESATVRMQLRFSRRRQGVFEPYWDAHLAGTVAREKEGWQWKRLLEANHRERKRL